MPTPIPKGLLVLAGLGTAFVVASHGSHALSDAGAWAAIVTAVVVVGGVVVTWLLRIGHGIYISGDYLSLMHGVPNQPEKRGVRVTIALTNGRANVPLRFQVERFTVTINGEDFHLNPEGLRPQPLSPGQRRGWFRHPQVVDASFPMSVLADYEIHYGAQSKLFWFLRRRIEGRTHFLIPVDGKIGEPLQVQSEDFDMAPTDQWDVPFSAPWRRSTWRT